MLATPTTAAPVSNWVGAPPAHTVILACAGQNPTGIHCTTSSLSQLKCPVALLGDATVIFRSAAPRSTTGLANVTVTGCATPTTSPAVGWTVAPANIPGGTLPDPNRAFPEPATAIAATPTATST